MARASLILLALLCGCSTIGRTVDGVGNFATVDGPPDALYRGAQPTQPGLLTLRGMGVKTIVNLRGETEAEEWEADAARQCGIKYVHIPCAQSNLEPAKVARFLAVMRSAPRPVFVHCHEGRDRTGLMIAVHRVAVQGWDRGRAVEELRAHGYNWAIYPGIERYVRQFGPADVLPPRN